VQVYVGSGPVAERAALEDQRRRRERQAAAEELEAELARYREIDALVERLCRATDLLLAAELMAAGFRKHGGQWRRRHGSANRSEDRADDRTEIGCGGPGRG
jgi:hypothetical protein